MTIEEFNFWFIGFVEGIKFKRPTKEQWAHVIEQMRHIEPRGDRTYAIGMMATT